MCMYYLLCASTVNACTTIKLMISTFRLNLGVRRQMEGSLTGEFFQL